MELCRHAIAVGRIEADPVLMKELPPEVVGRTHLLERMTRQADPPKIEA